MGTDTDIRTCDSVFLTHIYIYIAYKYVFTMEKIYLNKDIELIFCFRQSRATRKEEKLRGWLNFNKFYINSILTPYKFN